MQRTKYSPPEVASMWGVSADKVLAWIHSGELRAINVALDLTGRPRYRISIRDLENFESRRSVISSNGLKTKKRRKQNGVTEFF